MVLKRDADRASQLDFEDYKSDSSDKEDEKEDE